MRKIQATALFFFSFSCLLLADIIFLQLLSSLHLFILVEYYDSIAGLVVVSCNLHQNRPWANNSERRLGSCPIVPVHKNRYKRPAYS